MNRSVYHEGEIAVQTRAGVREAASRLGVGIRSSIPGGAKEFIKEQPMAVVGAVGEGDRLWASILTGRPGFLHVEDDRELRIDALPGEGDPLADRLKDGAMIGLLIIELETRRRMRLNGVAELAPDGGLLVHATEVFGNCPKYIQAREWRSETEPSGQAKRTIRRSAELSAEQRAWITRADTFFIASGHREAGVDVSHRGGAPGFVRFESEKTLAWGDYSGNNMFQTLGNLTANPQAGLLFLDFEQGRTLHLSGTAEVLWDKALAASYGGAGRSVSFEIQQVVEISDHINLRWRLLEYSPFNPA